MRQSDRLYKTSILIKTFWFLGGYGLFLILTILGSVYYISSSLEKINQSVTKFDELSHEIETLNQYFIRQAKDRKNLLLRGHNQKDLEKYSRHVDEMTQQIYLKIDEIEKNPLSVAYQSDLKFFKIKYGRLLKMYGLSFDIFQETQNYKKSDRFGRGYEGKVGQELFDIMQQIRLDRQKLLQNNKKNIRKFLIVNTTGLLLIILAYSGILIVFITDPIRRIVHFTNFLETQSGDRLPQIKQAKENDSDFVNIGSQVYQEIQKNDEIGYMVDTYSKLINSVVEYNNTLEKKVEERTRELQVAKETAEAANQTKSSFLANMSHELRTPLNAILGFTQLIQLDSSLERSQQDKLAIISRSGEHLLSLIDDVLDLSKIEAGKTELNTNDFSLSGLLKTTEEMLKLKADAKGIDLLFEYHPDLPEYINTDERKLRQVLINLLNNALKFTTEGRVVVRVKPDAKNIYKLTFEIEDTGAGIAENELSSLFDAFSQTRSGKKSGTGTGLGLSIGRKFVQLMQGDIEVRSQLGVGTVFTFKIVAKPALEKKLSKQKISKTVIGLVPNQPSYRILIADDDRENRQIVLQLLESIGFEVKEATNGQQAIDIWQSWQPQLIFMDIHMPVLNGYKASQEIKSQDKNDNTVILALTASVLEGECSHIISSGYDDFMRKPFRISELLGRLAKHLKVKYLYQESDTSLISNSKAIKLTSEDLEIMSGEWLDRIHQAALTADYMVIKDLIAEIEQEYGEIAGELDSWLQEFRMDKISELTGEAFLKKSS